VSRHTNDTPAKPTGTDPAARLRDIRARVSSLRERLAGEHDPKLVDAINVEMKKLSDLLSELISAAGKGTHQVAKAERIVWPHDLSAEAKSPGDWGADPMEVTIE
jgi:hypothetical protein